MSTILEADETGALRLPPSVLPHPAPRRRYRVAMASGQVVVDEMTHESAVAEVADRGAWLEELRLRRERNASQTAGTPLQDILDDIRGERA
ncbi:MAG: hypothetical protein ABJF10_28530 [Chthoniobacter sp.]|uniref:hypothetical protein n=1 Tax=Chthoniobacter sp. TaxID=2510640 RepID=UPI0032AE54AF